MNIFFLNNDAKVSANSLCTKHIVKMQLEAAQLLCGVFNLQGIEAPYKLSHANHPSAKWIRESVDNFEWLLEHGLEICRLYSAVYSKVHKSESVLNWVWSNYHSLDFPQTASTLILLAMPEEIKQKYGSLSDGNYRASSIIDAEKAYQEYYCQKTFKSGELTWKEPLVMPDWFKVVQ